MKVISSPQLFSESHLLADETHGVNLPDIMICRWAERPLALCAAADWFSLNEWAVQRADWGNWRCRYKWARWCGRAIYRRFGEQCFKFNECFEPPVQSAGCIAGHSPGKISPIDEYVLFIRIIYIVYFVVGFYLLQIFTIVTSIRFLFNLGYEGHIQTWEGNIIFQQKQY